MPLGIVRAQIFHDRLNIDRVHEQNLSINYEQALRICTVEWANLDAEGRKKYEDMQAEDKKRHTKELEAYHTKLFSTSSVKQLFTSVDDKPPLSLISGLISLGYKHVGDFVNTAFACVDVDCTLCTYNCLCHWVYRDISVDTQTSTLQPDQSCYFRVWNGRIMYVEETSQKRKTRMQSHLKTARNTITKPDYKNPYELRNVTDGPPGSTVQTMLTI